MPARRRFVLSLAGTAALACADLRLAVAAAPGARRFVWVILRGGLDGLAAVPVPGDPDFARIRGELAAFEPAPLPLAGPYALHPRLARLHQRFAAGELAIVHAVATPYRERSNFDAQQVLESGGLRAHELDTGWLGRALAATGARGLALAPATPLALRGAATVDSWSPSALPAPAPELLDRIERLYAGDPLLAAAFDRARQLHASAAMGELDARRAPGGRPAQFAALARAAGEFLARADGPRVAVLELGGWDSHAQQAAPQGPLARNLGLLDDGLDSLRGALGPAWRDTVVLVSSEFGRAVAPNGTRGTDHGTAGVAFVLGGAVAGGRVLGDWPGLAPARLHEGRDLRPTTDFRSLAAALLGPQLGLATGQLETVFPGLGPVRLGDELLRA